MFPSPELGLSGIEGRHTLGSTAFSRQAVAFHANALRRTHASPSQVTRSFRDVRPRPETNEHNVTRHLVNCCLYSGAFMMQIRASPYVVSHLGRSLNPRSSSCLYLGSSGGPSSPAAVPCYWSLTVFLRLRRESRRIWNRVLAAVTPLALISWRTAWVADFGVRKSCRGTLDARNLAARLSSVCSTAELRQATLGARYGKTTTNISNSKLVASLSLAWFSSAIPFTIRLASDVNLR